jgi:hypothetical protein
VKKGIEVFCGIVFVAIVLALFAPEIPSHRSVVFAQTSYNSCESSKSTVTSLGATTGTAATQVVALASGEPIYVCGLIVVGSSGTNPTFSLVYGTGTNCGSGQHTFLPAVATAANAPIVFPGTFVGAVPAGNAICYLDGGTSPVQNYILVTAQG